MTTKRISLLACSVIAFARTFFVAASAACFAAGSTHAALPEDFPVTDGLSVYLDAESVETSGSRVTKMVDRSGNGNHAHEIGVSEPALPMLVEGATPSGLPAVRFDGIGGFVEVGANPADFDGRSRTVFLVFRTDAFTANASAGAGRLLSTAYTIIDSWEPEYNQSINRHRTNEIWLQSQGVLRLNVRNPFGDFIAAQTPAASVAEGQFYIGVQEWRDNGDIFARIRNAANETFSGDAIGGMAEPEGHLHTRIGAGSDTRNTRPEEFFGGDVAAVLIYNRDLSTAEREDVEIYLYNAYLSAGGGAGDPGTPPVTNGLILHVNSANVVADGNAVTQMVDLSGRGNHAIGRVHNRQPGLPKLITAATPSGQDAVRFDGVGSLADVASNPEDFDGRAKTTITVFRPAYLAGSDYVTTTAYEILDPTLPVAEQSPFRTRTNWIRAFGDVGGNLRVSARTVSGGAINVSTANGSMKGGEFYIATNQLRENGDVAAILRDSNHQRFEAVASGADAIPMGHIATRLGGTFDSGNNEAPVPGEFFEGEIAAFLIYNRELSSAELQDVEAYLHATYLDAGSPGGAPGNPPVTDGLVLHLNGANVTVESNGEVTQLIDTSGHDNHAFSHVYYAVRPTGPDYIPAATPSGRPTVHFDGQLQYLEIAGNPSDFDGWGMTTMAVFKAEVLDGRVVNSAYQEVAPGLAVDGRTRFHELHPWATNNRLRANNRTDTGAFIGANTPDGTLFADQFYLGINLVRDNGETVAILRNVDNERFAGTNQSAPPNPQGHLHTRIGTGSGFGNTGLEMFFRGEVAAVVMYNRELDAEELEQVETYLYQRYLAAAAGGGSYAAWIAGFDVPAELSGPNDDASGDGVPNLIKYAIGADPTVASLDGLPQSVTETVGDEVYQVLTVQKNPDAEVLFLLEASTDLITWNPDPSNVSLIDHGDGLEYRVPVTNQPRLFLRLQVSAE